LSISTWDDADGIGLTASSLTSKVRGVEVQDLTRLARVRDLTRNGVARSIRLSRRLSLQEVADHVGVSISTVCRWELGDRRPRGEKALAYGALLDELVGGTRS
jgi:DNA-binding transcriptional regulator YiaG